MDKECKYIWHDEIKDRYFVMDQRVGGVKEVYKTGEFIKEFDSALTGQVGYKERIEKAGD